MQKAKVNRSFKTQKKKGFETPLDISTLEIILCAFMAENN
jgi:hypothetical protein